VVVDPQIMGHRSVFFDLHLIAGPFAINRLPTSKKPMVPMNGAVSEKINPIQSINM